MSEAPSKSFTSKKLDLLHRAMADARMTPGQFRYFTRALKGCNQNSGVSAVADQAFIDDVPDCGSRDTAKAMRKQIATLGYFSFVSGSGRTKTEYRFNWSANKQIETLVNANARRRAAKRAAEDKAWREGNGGPPPNSVSDGVSRPPLSERARAKRDGVTGPRGDGVSGPPQRVIQDPPYTLQNTPSPETPSYRATEESRYLQADHVDSDGVIIPRNFLSRLGDGDVDRGRELADHVPPGLLSKLLDRSSKFGVTSIASEIDNARKQAIAAIERRASA